MSDNYLLVLCWCETRIMSVRREDLLDGFTYPCKARRCREMAALKGQTYASKRT